MDKDKDKLLLAYIEADQLREEETPVAALMRTWVARRDLKDAGKSEEEVQQMEHEVQAELSLRDKEIGNL